MVEFQNGNDLPGDTEFGFPDNTSIPDPEMFLLFLDSLSPDQMSMLILSGALDDKFSKEDVGTQDFEGSFPSATERQGFDVEEWKNRLNRKIR